MEKDNAINWLVFIANLIVAILGSGPMRFVNGGMALIILVLIIIPNLYLNKENK